MKFFIDSADVDAIRKYAEIGLVDGVTTNPTIIMKSGREHKEVIREIASIISGPISVEGISDTCEEILAEAEEFRKWAQNVVIKVPMTREGLKAVKILEEKGVSTNVTLVFSASQALLAAKAGASYVSPFVGRLDDIGVKGMDVVGEIMDIYMNHWYKTKVIVASVRSLSHVIDSAKLGAHIATIPPKILDEMWEHDLTKKGIAQFREDYKKTSRKG
ncbi:MAG: fructose-6-phosphate aldolase [Candidatus ainarchaeum sp.]|nr:fructose-6-phosphate aldolase [Candidatus ainarchaeum sp.]